MGGVLLSVFGGERFGGADGKALIFLGLSFPLAGSFVLFPLTAFMFGGVSAFVYCRGKNKRVRFLPFLLVGMLTALL